MANLGAWDDPRRRGHRLRRAGRACLSCRTRKVKCDVMYGTPCYNCRTNGVECLTVNCRRGRKSSPKENSGEHSVWDEVPVERPFGYGEPVAQGAPTESNAKVSEPSFQGLPPSFKLHNNAADILNPLLSLGDVPIGLERLRSAAAAPSPISENSAFEELPAVFKAFPTHWSPLDLEYLHRKGALTIPSTRLRLEIIRCYLEYFHPYMPLLDVEELLQIVDPSISHPNRRKYSFLLFQCIMFAGIAFVNEELVQEVEGMSVKAARRMFYQKIRLLYDADVELDNLILVQCLLLMSQWAENTDTTKQNWHWTGIAASVAHAMRLTNNPDMLKLSQRTKSLRKRLWWCCFMRDRLLSLGMSRPMRIRDGDFDVPLPSVEDFECDLPIVTGPAEHPSNGQIKTSLSDRSTSTKLAQIFILNVKLCMNIGSIFSLQYTTFTKTSEMLVENSNSISANIMLYPISHQSTDHAFIQLRDTTFSLLDKSLTDWLDSLPEFTHVAEIFSDPDSGPLPREENQNSHLAMKPPSSQSNVLRQPSSVAVLAATVHMSYLATLSALHRPKIRSPASAQKVMEAAEGMAKICAFLNKNGLNRYLPVNTITMLLSSVMWHILSINTLHVAGGSRQHIATKDVRSHRVRDNLSELLVSLEKRREVHVGADFVAMLLQAFMVRSGSRVVRPASSTAGPGSPRSTGRREFELELNCNQAASTIPSDSGHTTAANQGPLTPQSQDLETAKAVAFDSNVPVAAHHHVPEQETVRNPDDFLTASVFNEDGAGHETFGSMFGFPDFDANSMTDAWGMNGSPNMALWEEGMASCNDLGFNLDWLA